MKNQSINTGKAREDKKGDSVTEKRINRLVETEDIYALLKERNVLLQELIAEKKEAILSTPKGNIKVKIAGRNKNYAQYYLRPEGDEKWKYIPEKSNEDIISAIVNRDYDEQIYRIAAEEQKNIEKLLCHRNDKALSNCFEKLNFARKKWVTPVIPSDEEFVKSWCSEAYPPLPFREEDAELYTKKGERVRSKSERMIANTLYEYGIPYRYEYPLIENNMIWARPDFTVLNIRKRKTYYWEHFGIMDDSNYAKSAVKKISQYMKKGFFQGETLISTYETSSSLLNESEVILLIKKYLI